MLSQLKIKIRDWLIWSQKYTGTDNVYLAKGGFWLTTEQLVSTAAAFLLAIAFANLLDPATYGNYKYILSLVGILGIFTLTEMKTAVTQSVARGLEGSFYVGFKTKLKWGALGSLAAMGLAGYYWLQGNELLPIPLLISAVFLPLMHASGIYGNFLAGRKLFKVQTKYNIPNQIISVGAMIIALFLTKNLFWLIAVYLISRTSLNYFFYVLTKIKFQPNKKEDSKTLSYGKHLSFVNVIGRVTIYLDRLLIFHYLGAAEVAIYSFALAPPTQLRDLFSKIPTLALPKLVRHSFKEINALLHKRLVKLFLIGSCVALIYILLAPYLFKIFFPKYLDSIFFSQLFAITIALVAPISLLSAAKQSKLTYYPKSWLYWGIIPHIVLIIALFFLIKPYGLTGVVMSRIIFFLFGIALGLTQWKLIVAKYSKE